jgi:hypothetical protein
MERKLKRRGPDAPHNDCANDSKRQHFRENKMEAGRVDTAGFKGSRYLVDKS